MIGESREQVQSAIISLMMAPAGWQTFSHLNAKQRDASLSKKQALIGKVVMGRDYHAQGTYFSIDPVTGGLWVTDHGFMLVPKVIGKVISDDLKREYEKLKDRTIHAGLLGNERGRETVGRKDAQRALSKYAAIFDGEPYVLDHTFYLDHKSSQVGLLKIASFGHSLKPAAIPVDFRGLARHSIDAIVEGPLERVEGKVKRISNDGFGYFTPIDSSIDFGPLQGGVVRNGEGYLVGIVSPDQSKEDQIRVYMADEMYRDLGHLRYMAGARTIGIDDVKLKFNPSSRSLDFDPRGELKKLTQIWNGK